jgi:hypothetical protein
MELRFEKRVTSNRQFLIRRRLLRSNSDVNRSEGNEMNRLFVTIFMTALLLWKGSYAWAQFSEAGVEKFRVAVDAPDFMLKELGGGKISLKELRGKVVLLNFFATW